MAEDRTPPVSDPYALDKRASKTFYQQEDPVMAKLLDIKNALTKKGKITDEEVPVYLK